VDHALRKMGRVASDKTPRASETLSKLSFDPGLPTIAQSAVPTYINACRGESNIFLATFQLKL
jgi:hypothetical protein